MILRCGSHSIDLSTPVVMGVLNVTPDSFSDGGRWLDRDSAVAHAVAMVDEGAAIIDVGGESTRPGASDVSEEEEMRRVVPVISALARRTSVPISIDTSRATVARAACEAGASFINDVRALTQPGMLEVAARSDAAICLMHMQGEPREMQNAPNYTDVVREVASYLAIRVAACKASGIKQERLVVDPGIGFGKRLEHNLELLRQLDRLRELSLPLLIGVSRKSLIGALTGRNIEVRLAGSIAMATAAVLGGASIIRAHDVGATLDAVKVATALRSTPNASHDGEQR